MPDSLTPEYWRRRAKEVRTRAEQITDPQVRQTLLRSAHDYETLAKQAEGLRRGGLLQSEVGKNVIRLSVEKVCHGVIMVVRHWLVNGSCGCDRNRTQDQGSGQDARNFRNHNGSPLISDCPSLAFR
jgi:hypothetical protein